MNRKNYFNFLLVTLFVALNFSFTQAQTGAVRGNIADETGIYVPGAAVLIPELNKGTTTDFDGNFTLVEIPEGTYTLVVKYMGYEDLNEEVKVAANQTLDVDLILNSSTTTLETVQLLGGGLSAQARALNAQKNKTNITNIVSTEQIGKFPDANIGDAVKRIPGITMQVDQGEARNIIVRGLAPQLNSVTLNGSRIPSAEGDNRNVQMDLIPSDMIQTIEVSKAVTPDMDGDALGGSVNLVTRSAPEDFRLAATVGSGINFITDKRILSGSFLVGDRTKDGKFGYMVSASINDNDFGSDNVEAEWSDEFEYNTGQQDSEGEDILQEMDVNPYTSAFEIRKYLVQRVRRSFSANLNYDINDNNSLYFKSMYNWRDDRENRFAYASEILDGEDIGEGDFTITNGNLVRFPAEAERETKGGIPGGRIQNRRLEDQRMQNYTLGGDHLFGKLKFDWMGSYAKASEERPNERYISWETEYMVSNGTDPEKPLQTPVSAASPVDFELKEITEEYQYTEEEDINVFANFELPVDFFNQGSGILKFGARGRFKNKSRDNNFFEYSPANGFNTMEDTEVISQNGREFLAGGQYLPGFFTSADYLGTLNLNNQDLFESDNLPDEYLQENFEAEENVYAGYVMANQKLSENFSILAGVRLEATNISSLGNELIFNEDGDFEGATPVRDESNYTNILPGVHLKYNATDNTVLRFAWTNTLARPNYIDLVPYRAINNEDEEISIGNTDLDPSTSMNFDFMAEYYFSSVGILSGGVFYKDIEDFVYTYISEDQATGYDLFQPLNGDKANIYGAEVSFQRQLNFLPGFARNFGVYLNYTYLHSEANGIRNEDGDLREDELSLPGSSPNMFNGSLSYSDKRFSARLSANFSDAYLDELGGNAFEDRYYDEQLFVDFNMSYSINKNLRIFADLNNITNQPLRYYQGVANRTMQMEYYSQRLTFGLKYDLY
ncbi:TonB-dependent receptor [Zunongwangia atlantica]|uniref:TonB-dependent outer membrane receptor protein n=1 Tax=Zunongwangia atlantica 22II14-10F7 TaxID=1185767 RepID=A0A1Y1T6N2_9FLAO|nr:TonB-dependent receptor [Zunongwangia atlantica]ORL46083.1 TonB-dependent outer membrane receptor protein [Zunongwangia atlantica 22II14-10F7]